MDNEYNFGFMDNEYNFGFIDNENLEAFNYSFDP